MNRFYGRGSVVIASLALVLAMSQLAEAQRRGRGFGLFGGASPATLAGVEEVQAELKLNEEQKSTVNEISERLRSDRRDLFQQDSDFRGRREQLEKLNREATAKVNAALSEPQRKRLQEIWIQASGATALTDAEMAKTLKLTADQQSQLEEIQRDNFQAFRDAFQDLGDDASPEERRAKMEEVRTERDKKMLAVLTTDQQQQYEKMKGEKFDTSQLFGRRRRT